MMVRVIHRIPDKDTLEREDTYKHNVETVKVYKGFGGMFVHLIFRNGNGLHLSLNFFDFEIMEEDFA